MSYVIYSKPDCGHCTRAKALLSQKSLPFEEHVLDTGQVKDPRISYYSVSELQKLVPGVRTVPQIFKDNKLIGGFDALQKHLTTNKL